MLLVLIQTIDPTVVTFKLPGPKTIHRDQRERGNTFNEVQSRWSPLCLSRSGRVYNVIDHFA